MFRDIQHGILQFTVKITRSRQKIGAAPCFFIILPRNVYK